METVVPEQTGTILANDNNHHDIMLFDDALLRSENGVEYRLRWDDYLGGGGEGAVYKALRVDTQELFAAKVYAEELTEEARTRRRKTSQILSQYADYTRYHLMPVLDYGIAEITTAPNKNVTCWIDIMPYFDQLTSFKKKQMSAQDLQTVYLPQIETAIRTLHGDGLIHRDINPSNLLIVDKDTNGRPIVVLSDYGTAGILAHADPAARLKGIVIGRGTPGYRTGLLVYNYASDMFALGCTIGELFHGEYFYPEEQKENSVSGDYDIVNKLQACIVKNEWPFQTTDNGPLAEKLKQLFLGLVRQSDIDRFKLDDVRAFCEQGIDWTPRNTRSIVQPPFRVRIFSQEYSSKEALAEGLNANWDHAITCINGKLLTRQLSDSSESDVAMNLEELADDHSLSNGERLTLAIHCLKPDQQLLLHTHVYQNETDLCTKAAQNDPNAKTDLEFTLRIGFLSQKLRELQKKATEPEETRAIIERLARTERAGAFVNTLGIEFAYYYLIFGTVAEDVLKANQMIETSIDWEHPAANWQTLFDIIVPNTLDGYLHAGELLSVKKSARMLALICHLEEQILKEQAEKDPDIAQTATFIETLLKKVPKSNSDRCELVFHFFDALCPAARERYLYCGPFAHIVWVQNHINLYQFPKDPEKSDIKKRLLSYRVDPHKLPSVKEIKEGYSELIPAYNDLVQSFANNLLAAYLGIETWDHHDQMITSNSSRAFFTVERLGHLVPNGLAINPYE